MPKLKLLITLPKYSPTTEQVLADPDLQVRLVDEPSAGVHGEIANDWPIE